MAAVQQMISGHTAATEAAAGGLDLGLVFERAISVTHDPRIRMALVLERIRIRRSSTS